VAVASATNTVIAELRVDDALRAGVVSMPHGWGHSGPGLRTPRSAANPGSNYNALVDDTTELEALTSSPIFNGVPVSVIRLKEEHP
jgi:formate dehydrogenase